MNIATFNKILLPILQSGITPWLWSAHAKGKTETIENFYKSRGWLLFNFRLNCMADVGDFIGLQDFEVDKKGNKIASKFCTPDWLKKCIDFCQANPDKRACIFMDEINRAARFDLLGPVFQISLDRRLHTYEFPSNLDVICASNPNSKDYKVLAVTDKALLSRFCHINFNPTKQEWFDYAKENNYDNDVLQFLGETPQALENDDLESFSISDYSKPDRRKWAMINKLQRQGLLSAQEKTEVYSGLVGVELAVAFEAFLKNKDKPVSLEEILTEYHKVKPRIVKAADTAESRTDIIGKAVKEVISYFEKDPALTETQGQNIIEFIKDLPNEHMFQTMHAIYRKRKFHDFCEDNYKKLNMLEIEKRLEIIRQSVSPESLVNNNV
jgi:hypothetical protein